MVFSWFFEQPVPYLSLPTHLMPLYPEKQAFTLSNWRIQSSTGKQKGKGCFFFSTGYHYTRRFYVHWGIVGQMVLLVAHWLPWLHETCMTHIMPVWISWFSHFSFKLTQQKKNLNVKDQAMSYKKQAL